MLFFIIGGIRVRHKEIDQGKFFCPKCKDQRSYKHKRVTRYFSLYFIPLVPLGQLGEFVECQTCGIAFEPTALQVRGPVQTHRQATKPALSLAQIINTLPARLNTGTPLEFLVRDLTAAGVDHDAALAMVKPHLGEGQKTCSTCNLTYVNTITACTECGKTL